MIQEVDQYIKKSVAIFSLSTITDTSVLLNYLSAREIDQNNQITNTERKTNWITGRLAAKHLFLERNNIDNLHDKITAILEIKSSDILQYPEQEYSQVEVLRPSVENKKPQLFFRGNPRHETISISHSKKSSVVCLSSDQVSIDIEEISRKTHNFYTHNFSSQEREWAITVSSINDVSIMMLFTLLWSIKECFIKSTIVPQINLWNMPGIWVEVTTFTVEKIKNTFDRMICAKVCIHFKKTYQRAFVEAYIDNKNLITISKFNKTISYGN